MGWKSEEKAGQTERVQVKGGQWSLEKFPGLEGEAELLLYETAGTCRSLRYDKALLGHQSCQRREVTEIS